VIAAGALGFGIYR